MVLGIHKATTTFGPSSNTDNLVYSTTKINGNANGDLIASYTNAANVNGTIRTTYESTTLNRKNTHQPSIDEEISAAKKTPSHQSRTLERKHIQNSEC